VKKITIPAILFILTGGLILQILVGTFLVEEWVFGDSHATIFEQIMYHLAVIPPFVIAILFYKETQKLSKSFGYSGIFYLISIALVIFYHSVPTRTDYPGYEIYEQTSLGSYGFYVTGGGVGPLAIIPNILLTIIIILAIHKYYKK